ncbi:16S rRNA (cytosine(1402)-N(4))-methyltransferase RsmH [Patescibacteria group bacterium]|nr:16S rRNA (cytosine(1402)-N(4))-methyltransferase RsmH [Patescibacteria group bacterium]
MAYHYPVLLQPVIHYFDPQPGDCFIDATLGNGGHTLALLQKGATVYGLDRDQSNLELATHRLLEAGLLSNFIPLKLNFADIHKIIEMYPQVHFKGILFDLGLSQNQLQGAGRGFSFSDTQSLDMRLDNTAKLSAKDIINHSSATELFIIFSKIAQEPFSQELADLIVKERHHQPITTAADLAQIIKDFYHHRGVRTDIHPATKILMALRIVVNEEYLNLNKALEALLNFPQSQVAIITFHSGEDRLVKQFTRQHSSQILCTPKPITPSPQEIKENPLSRSAKLRLFKIK